MFIRSKTTCILVASLFTIASIKTQPKQLSVDERIKKMHCVQMCTTEYYLALKKDIETVWMNLEDIMINVMKVTDVASFHLYVESKTC